MVRADNRIFGIVFNKGEQKTILKLFIWNYLHDSAGCSENKGMEYSRRRCAVIEVGIFPKSQMSSFKQNILPLVEVYVY